MKAWKRRGTVFNWVDLMTLVIFFDFLGFKDSFVQNMLICQIKHH